MCKNKDKQKHVNKSIDEMTDHEFVKCADRLSSPYYRAYMSAKEHAQYAAFAEPAYNVPVDPFDPSLKKDNTKDKKGKNTKKKKKNKNSSADTKAVYSKKRVLPLLLIMLLMLVTVAVCVIGFVGIDAVADYIGIYNIPNGEEKTVITESDPIIAMVKSFVSLDMDSVFYAKYLNPQSDGAELLTKISLYAVPVACTLMLLCGVIGLIKAFAALCSGRKKNGCYKKYKFGLMSFIMLLCGVIMLLGGLFVASINLTEIADFVLFKSTVMQAGYGLYAMIIIPILVWILTCFGYKKSKK